MNNDLLSKCRTNPDKVYWFEVSVYQTLSESFIREFADKVDWYWISRCQTLSENFIREFADRVGWYCISVYQTLSESFIREFADRVYWCGISHYQTLSENFIREFADRVDFYIPPHTWLYKTAEEKLELARKAGYTVRNNRIVAHKSVCRNMASVYKPGMVYEVGGRYRASNCDCLPSHQDSFGLSAWTKERALEYHSRGLLLEVEINLEDLGVIVYEGGKIRCFGLRVVKVAE